jgi:hypothetical protein
MRRIVAWVAFGVVLAAAAWPVPRVRAQQDEAAQQKAAELVRLYERWKQAQDPEESIALGEQCWPWSPR